MGIPKGITREHVEQAMQQLNEGIDHPFGESVRYDLWYEGRTYAPKAVVALAAKSATGASLGPHDFSGREGGGAANRVLSSLGFDIRPKAAVSDQGRAVWLEMTQSSHRHGGPGWEFGTCLWSPSRSRTDTDSYAIMRKPEEGDRVLHSQDSAFVGESVVSQRWREVAEEPPSAAPWEGMSPYYRIEVRDYRPFDQSYRAVPTRTPTQSCANPRKGTAFCTVRTPPSLESLLCRSGGEKWQKSRPRRRRGRGCRRTTASKCGTTARSTSRTE